MTFTIRTNLLLRLIVEYILVDFSAFTSVFGESTLLCGMVIDLFILDELLIEIFNCFASLCC